METPKQLLRNILTKYAEGEAFDVLIPPNPKLGDHATNLAFIWAKKENKNPKEVGDRLVEKLSKDSDIKKYFHKIEVAGNGFVNFFVSDDFARRELKRISRDKKFGYNNYRKGQKIMVEFTDPNPFKLFHIGHLMSNAIGESISRLYEATGAKVTRVTYQGDVGLHVAKAVWGIKKESLNISTFKNLKDKIKYLGEAYTLGARSYEENPEAKTEIEEINKKIYDRSDEEINKIYDAGKKLSLEYFEEIYKKLRTKFEHNFFESEFGPKGIEIIKQHPEIFEESEGAVVFRGEKYGLHTRVFINSAGLPVYEAKELGLNKYKFEKYSPDSSVIVTGNEINDYFKVLLKAMELTMPEVAKKTKHIGHGMLRFATGKMSSRTGDVITAEELLEQLKSKIKQKAANKTEEEYDIQAVAAIKYQILKQNIGHDIIFDFDKALSITGDAAPYIQYTYARLRSIGRKSKKGLFGWLGVDLSKLTKEEELALIKQLLNFPDVVRDAAELHTINTLTTYLYKLASDANYYYETVRILSDDTKRPERNARLLLVETIAQVLKSGLYLLGIKTLERV